MLISSKLNTFSEHSENVLGISNYLEDLWEQWTMQEPAFGHTALMSKNS